MANDVENGLMTIVNRGLNNRKTRDTTQNDVSSRSIVIFAVFYSKVKASNHIHQNDNDSLRQNHRLYVEDKN